MGAYYGTKILNGVINPKTGNPWSLEDVPSYWQKKVKEYLDNHGAEY